jgi:hypothetical protein
MMRLLRSNGSNPCPKEMVAPGAMAGVLGNWAAQSPQEAAKYVAQLNGAELERGMKSVVSSMAGADPGYTAQWVKQFPEGPMRQDAEEALMKRWAGQDPQAAASWLASLPQGANRDAAVKQFVDNASAHEPGLAFQWALTTSDPSKQKDLLEKAAAQWLRVNDADARAGIQATSLPEELRAKLLKPRD